MEAERRSQKNEDQIRDMIPGRVLGVHTISHALVDMGCAMLIYAMTAQYLTDMEAFLAVLLYDFIAFCLQFPLGMWLDGKEKKRIPATDFPRLAAVVGMFLVAWVDVIYAVIRSLHGDAPVVVGVIMYLSFLAGIGNALFHIGAGVEVLNHSGKPEQAGPSGIFVSAGALGLYLGAKAKLIGIENLYVMAAALVVLSIVETRSKRLDNSRTDATSSQSVPDTSTAAARVAAPSWVTLLLTLIIVYRSFLGFAMKYTWRVDFKTGLIAVIGIVLGKAIGGIVSDRFGWRKVMISSLLIGAAAALYSEDFLPAGVLTLFLFNMTMPVTMVGLARALPGEAGMAFGLNTVALFIGFAVHLMTGGEVSSWVLCALILLSAIVLAVALRPVEDQTRKE